MKMMRGNRHRKSPMARTEPRPPEPIHAARTDFGLRTSASSVEARAQLSRASPSGGTIRPITEQQLVAVVGRFPRLPFDGAGGLLQRLSLAAGVLFAIALSLAYLNRLNRGSGAETRVDVPAIEVS